MSYFNTNTELPTNKKWNLSNMHRHTSKPLLVSVASSLSTPYQDPSELMEGRNISMVLLVNSKFLEEDDAKQTNLYLSSCSCNVKRTSSSSSDTSSYKTSRKVCTENTKKICIIAHNSKKPSSHLYQKGRSYQFTYLGYLFGLNCLTNISLHCKMFKTCQRTYCFEGPPQDC